GKTANLTEEHARSASALITLGEGTAGRCRGRRWRRGRPGDRASVKVEEVASPYLATITSDALITANASSPVLRARSSTASLEIDEVTITPPPMSIRAWAVVWPLVTATILPLSWLR